MRGISGSKALGALRVVLFVLLAFSMSLYWDGAVKALRTPTAPPTPGPQNPGKVFNAPYVPIVQPKPQISTLYEEFPLVDPSYQVKSDSVVFSTSFGQYEFSKNEPWMSFTYRDGTPLISHSVFYVNSSLLSPIQLKDYAIDMNGISNRRLQSTAKLESGGTEVGKITVSVVFDRVQRPKITAHVDATPTLTSAGFNVLWILRGLKTTGRMGLQQIGVNFSNATSFRSRIPNMTRLELDSGNSKIRALVDWGDAPAGSKLSFGRFPSLSFLSGSVAVVIFPRNAALIDPSIVAQGSGASSASSFQRHTFFDGALYWAFYYNGSNTVYKYSFDGRNWDNPAHTIWPFKPTAVWFNSGNVYILAGSTGSPTVGPAYLYFIKGVVSGTNINWNAYVTVDSYTYTDAYAVGWEIRDVNLAVGSDGLITVAYTTSGHTWYDDGQHEGGGGGGGDGAPPITMSSCDHELSCETSRTRSGSIMRPETVWESSYRALRVKKSQNVNGTTWGSSTVILSQSHSDVDAWYNRYEPILSPLANGGILGIYNDKQWRSGSDTIMYSSSAAWTSANTLDSSSGYTDEEFGSAVSNSDFTVHFAYVYSDNTIRYRSYNGTWSTPVTIAPAVSYSPAIALGPGNDLYVLFIKYAPNYVYEVHYSGLSGWGSPTIAFGTSMAGQTVHCLSAGANATNGYLVGLWTEAQYTIKLGSLPVDNGWSPYSVPSTPWDKEGLIPYGLYFHNLNEYVNPQTGLLTILQTDFDLPGRGIGPVGDLGFTRVFRTPYTFLGSTPYNYEDYPYANLGLGWSLNWPWLGTDYLHLWNGQGYKIAWTSNVFENHKGDNFKLIKNANGTYSLFDKSGILYRFDTGRKLAFILDQTGNNQLTFTYDGSSRISYITDTVGRTVNLSYDGNGRLSTVTSGGRVWTYGYNSNGNLISVQDPLQRTTSYQYTSAYNNYLLTRITYPTTAYTNYQYVQAPIGTETNTYPVGIQASYLGGGTTVRQTSYSYTVGAADHVIASTLTLSNGTATQGYLTYNYTSSSATETTQNAQAQLVRKSIKAYDAQGNINRETIFLGNSALNYTNYYGYDDWGNVVYQRLNIDSGSYRETYYSYANANTQNRFVDFNGDNMTDFSNAFYTTNVGANIHDLLVGRAEYQNGAGSSKIESYQRYSSVGRLLESKSLLGASQWLVTSFTYDSYGNVLTRTDAKGNVTSYEYSATYQYAYPTKVSNTVGGLVLSTQYAYNFTTGDRITVTSPSGNSTDYRYDSIGRLTTATHPSVGGVRAQRRISYDDVNNVVTIYDENNNYGKLYYDGLARWTKAETYSSGSVYSTETYTYYWNDRVKTHTDPTGNVTTFQYDALARPVKATFPDGTFTQASYDDVNTKATLTDQKGHATDYAYDWLSRLITVTEYVSGQAHNSIYTYDRVGNLVQVKDAINQITTYTYDSLNRLTRIDFPDTTYETRTYDNLGNLVLRTTQNSTMIRYAYDEINRRTRINHPDASSATFSYDKDGNRLQMIDPASNTAYTYDARNRLLSETRNINGQSYPLSYQYDAASNLLQLTYPNGYQVSYTYDSLNRIITVGNLATLTYRKDNRIASITYGNGVQTTHSYDQLGRTTRILTHNSTATLLDLNYGYDLNGNVANVNTNQETYAYDDLNRLTGGNGLWGTRSYAYDAVGNRLSETVNGTQTSYTYGSYNKLLSAGTTSFTYDNNGNMVTKVAGSNSWRYVYDFENKLKQVQLSGQNVLQALYDGDGRRITTTDGLATTIFHYRSGSWDPIYVNDLGAGITLDAIFAGKLRIGKVQAGVSYYYHLDRLGSIRLVTKDQNNQTFITKYLPYGTPFTASGTEQFRYTGKQLDQSTGLYYYGCRYYDSQLGVFITLDPQQADLQNPQSLNRYSYALNNPNRYIDHDGSRDEPGDVASSTGSDVDNNRDNERFGGPEGAKGSEGSGGSSGNPPETEAGKYADIEELKDILAALDTVGISTKTALDIIGAESQPQPNSEKVVRVETTYTCHLPQCEITKAQISPCLEPKTQANWNGVLAAYDVASVLGCWGGWGCAAFAVGNAVIGHAFGSELSCPADYSNWSIGGRGGFGTAYCD